MNFGLRVILLLPATFATRAAAQKPMLDTTREPVRASRPAAALRDTIVSADSSLFAAFNRGELTKLMSFFARDLEFYQDNEGVENYAQTRADFAHMFAQPARIRRELVPGSLEVFPIKNYGAMEVGRHRFCHVEGGKQDCGTFRFVHIWRRTSQGWQISRVVSYGH
jgi:ketosteroid isomerase-like protein